MRSLLMLLMALLLAGEVQAKTKSADVFEQNRRLGRGVNIMGYDPIWRSRDRARFQAKHFRLLKEAGFNSVRLNLYPFRFMNPTNDFAVSPSWWQVMDWAVKNAQKQGLAVILDLHEYGEMGKDPQANQARFLAFWRQLSAHCQKAPDSVYFEILNEPCRQLTPALWNTYLKEALAIIREKNPSRPVIVGPAYWNSFQHLEELELPAEDNHLIVTIHYYLPMSFTHQGASWTDQKYQVGVPWQGDQKDLETLNGNFDQAAAWATAHHRPLFLGEFGAYDKGPMDSRARYTAAVARAAEQRGWSWAYWQFDSDFILYDIGRDAWVEPIRGALCPR